MFLCASRVLTNHPLFATVLIKPAGQNWREMLRSPLPAQLVLLSYYQPVSPTTNKDFTEMDTVTLQRLMDYFYLEFFFLEKVVKGEGGLTKSERFISTGTFIKSVLLKEAVI